MRTASALPTVLLIAIVQVASSNAAFEPHRSFSRATDKFHKFALKHSAGLARDLRIAFSGLAGRAVSEPDDSQKVLCARPGTFVSPSNSTSPASAPDNGGHVHPSTTGHHGGVSSTSSAKGPGSTSLPSPSSLAPQPAPTSAFKLQESHSGNNFFDGWDFWNLPDPTHGTVDYLSQSDAQSANLVEINQAGNAVMKVDTTPQVAGNRKSIRITTQSTFTQGIFVLDAVHMPQGCGTWPAFWSNGPNWPAGGEIDIIEGVNDYTDNQATIHTNPGCNLPNGATGQSLGISGTVVGGTNCAAAETNNAGCGIVSNSNTTYGAGFNSIGGGVYAMKWDDDGISVYFFPRGQIPNDLLAEAPQPQSWGQPMAFWPSTDCNQSQFFYQHSIIFDTTLCGDWAGGVWGDSGAPGQETSCAARTGFATCQDFVANSGASFADAYWEVSSVKIYQTSRQS